MPIADKDPLRSRLHEVEEEIRGRVQLVCKSPPPEDLDTGAMIRFEEELSIVTSAAKEAVSLKRRLRLARTTEGLEPRATDRAPGRHTAHDAGPETAA
jgi:hypothetical protein